MNVKRKPRATEKDVLQGTADRLQVDADVLTYLVKECLKDILSEAHSVGSCTLRGLGRFKLTTLQSMLADEREDGKITVFEPTRHAPSTAFSALRRGLKLRAN